MSNKPIKIFLVEDDLSLDQFLNHTLKLMTTPLSGRWWKICNRSFQKRVLMSVFLIFCYPCRWIYDSEWDRQINNEVPIIFLTAKKLKEDVLKGYGVVQWLCNQTIWYWYTFSKNTGNNLKNVIFNQNKDFYEIGKFVFNSNLRTLTLEWRKKNCLQRSAITGYWLLIRTIDQQGDGS